MSVKHTFVSAKTDGADATQVQPSNWNADHVADANGVNFTTSTSNPSAPASGLFAVFGKLIAGAAMLCGLGPSGNAYALQPWFAQKRIAVWYPNPNSTSTTNAALGMLGPSTTGTTTARAPASTNYFTQCARVGFVSSATANSRSQAYYNGSPPTWRGNAAGLGGYRAVFRFGVSDAATVATANMFIGMAPSSSIGSAGTEPSAAINIFGVGADSTDTNLQIMTNDGSGTATKTSLGANFPANTLSTDVYELVVSCAPNASSMEYQVTRLNTGHVATGSISSDLPTSTLFLLPQFMRGNLSTALAVGLDVMSMYIETEI